MISNLLNNAYEALTKNRKISITMIFIQERLQLQIHDSGLGIPKNQLRHVLNGSSLKHTGEGLGLTGAKKYMSDLGGEIKLSSKLNEGTAVTLLFPIKNKPHWYPDSITLSNKTPIIILDDDTSMHNFWRHQLQSHSLFAIHFTNSKDCFEWYDNNPHLRDIALYLIDFELRNDMQNGLNILTKIDVKSRGYLITSHAEDIVIQQNCEHLGVWLIPKTLAGEITMNLNC